MSISFLRSTFNSLRDKTVQSVSMDQNCGVTMFFKDGSRFKFHVDPTNAYDFGVNKKQRVSRKIKSREKELSSEKKK
jgi:hypothetical protein